ncbi:MAG TPA: hypothetical protein VNW52_09585, partial [Burkholderiaceae bacterium]|nr:hypothetical protein [Burkholderiaceae bacterium]
MLQNLACWQRIATLTEQYTIRSVQYQRIAAGFYRFDPSASTISLSTEKSLNLPTVLQTRPLIGHIERTHGQFCSGGIGQVQQSCLFRGVVH